MSDTIGHQTMSVYRRWSVQGSHKLVARIAELEAKNDRFGEALVILQSSAYCENLHHCKKHQHKSGEPCPVEVHLADLMSPQ